MSLLTINDFETESLDIQKYTVLMLYIESVSAIDWSSDDYKMELSKIAQRLVQEFKKTEGARLQKLINESEQNGDHNQAKILISDYQKVLSL